MIEAPPPMSEPSPTTTPWLIRPSTIEVPSVPALKLTKPSCMTVVPLARWAPRRTRSASAMRTPDGHDVVGHPRELVDAEDLHGAARAAVGTRASSNPSTAHGPCEVHTTLVSTPKSPSRLTLFGAHEPVREQVQPQVGVGGVGRRCVEVGGRPGAPRAARRRAASRRRRADSRPAGAASSPAPPGSPRAGGREPRVEHGSVVGEGDQAVTPGGARHADQPTVAHGTPVVDCAGRHAVDRPPRSTSPPTSVASPPRCATSSRSSLDEKALADAVEAALRAPAAPRR